MTDLRFAEIRLKNWKAYRRADLTLPTAAEGRVVLLSGKNGAGKTSLIEALVLGLYGKEGLPLVARAADRRRGDVSYDGFLERAMNRSSRDEGMMSVEVVFTGGPLRRVSLERVWYFNGSGKHDRDDEDVRIRSGEDEDIVSVPAEGRDDFLRAFVGENLLPLNLASFFLFDGEHVDRLSGQDLDQQVRSAVEAMLGVPLLRQTLQDLRTFARECRRNSREANGSALSKLRDEVSAFETQEASLSAAVEATNAELSPLRVRRDALVGRIGALHGDSYANFKGLFEAREMLSRTRAEQQEALRKALSVDLAFALAGENLRRAVRNRLGAEALRDQWEAGLETSDKRYAAFTALLSAELRSEAHLEQLELAWRTVWNTPPEGSATEIRHGHLGDAERHLVTQHLSRVTDAAGDQIAELARAVQITDEGIVELETQIARQNGADDQSQALADQLRGIQEAIAALEASHKFEVQALDALRAELAPRKAELGRMIQHHASVAPILRRSDRAEAYAALLEDVIESVLPGETAALSRDVTAAYKAMAHKGEVECVDISLNGEVRLLDGSGEDLRGRDTSAGETQVFALALMAAIASGSRPFPIVMDTPFARLDPQHRRNVLRHFADVGSQLVLLAHPAELAAEDLDDLGDALAPAIEVINEEEGRRRTSRIVRGKPSNGT